MQKYEVCYNEYRFDGESNWNDWSEAIEAHIDRGLSPFDGAMCRILDTLPEAEAFVNTLSDSPLKDRCAALIYCLSVVDVDEDGEFIEIINTIRNGAAAFGSRFFLQKPVVESSHPWIV